MKYLFYMICCCLFFVACDDKEIGDVNTGIDDHTPYLQNSWELNSVLQIDEQAGPGKLKSLDISNSVIAGQSSSLVFDGNNYTATGVLEKTLGATGAWEFDDAFFPTEIQFTQGSATRSIALSQSIRSFSTELKLQEKRTYCADGTNSVSYEYVFVKK